VLFPKLAAPVLGGELGLTCTVAVTLTGALLVQPLLPVTVYVVVDGGSAIKAEFMAVPVYAPPPGNDNPVVGDHA